MSARENLAREFSERDRRYGTIAIPADAQIICDSKNSWNLTFLVDESTPGVSAHFPVKLLVAGYMQQLWIEHLVCSVLKDFYISKFVDIKFLQQIEVPSTVSLLAKFNAEKETLEFQILSTEQTLSTKGRVKLEKKQVKEVNVS